jgi:hypothetical protein
MDSAATAPVQILWKETIVYVRPFAADTESIVWLRELDRLLTLENYNGLTLQAAKNAYEKARDYLTDASKRMILPIPEFTPDGDGGIEIEWERNGRRLVISFKAHEEDTDFISWREPQSRYEGGEVTKDLLKDRLNWLLS